MADEAKKFTTRTSQIQSKIQEANLARQKQEVSSTQATQAWSTSTPTITDTPKVTQTAKTIPSITRPEITPVNISTPSTKTSDVKDLFASKTTPTLRKAATPDLLSKATEERDIRTTTLPLNLVRAANTQWWAAKEAVDKTLIEQFTDWFSGVTKKSEEDSQYYANKLAQSWVGDLWWAIFDLGEDVIDYTTSALWYYSNKAIDTVAKSLWAKDTSITRERNEYWEKRFTQEEREETERTVSNLVKSYGQFFNDSEFYIAKLIDLVSDKMWHDTWLVDKMSTQFNYWDKYEEEKRERAETRYQSNEYAQELRDDVSDYFFKLTWNKDLSDTLWDVAWQVYSSVTDPSQIASVVWYMAPAIFAQYVLWWAWLWWKWNLLAWTAIWTPSQAANVYKDFANDEWITNNLSDWQVFTISTWVWVVLSMIEQLWDALWDMPWAKWISKEIRKLTTKNLKNLFSKWIKKETIAELEKVIDKNLIKDIRKPALNALKKWFLWGMWEWVEEWIQDTIQEETAVALGSERWHITLKQLLTSIFAGWWFWWMIQWPWLAVNIKQNQDLKEQYDEFSDALDKVAPWINKETKEAFFSAMVTSQQKDANLSEKRVEKYESQVTQLYNQISQLEQQLETTADENTKTQVNNQIDWLNNQIKEIDKKINQWNNTREEINKAIEEYNQQRELEEEITPQEKQQLSREEWWENLSEQTMITPKWQASIKVKQLAPLKWWDKKVLRQDFEESVKQIAAWTDYWDTKFAYYAYYNQSEMVKDTKDRIKMINKVEDLLRKIWVRVRYTTDTDRDIGKWVTWLYESDKKRVTYTYGDNKVQIYWHEVFHAIMDIIHNWEITNTGLHKKLKNILDGAINEVKKQFGIDIYKEWDKLYWANTFAEEWLANSFWEYLANKELTWPKSFVQKIEEFFRDLINLFFNKDWLAQRKLSKKLQEAFDAIANWEVVKQRNTFYSRSLIWLRLWGKSSNPIESSTEFTQEELRNTEWYTESQEENALQTKQQNELWEHWEEIMEAWKESDFENEIYNDAMDVEPSQDVLDGKVSTTPQTIRDAFWKDKKKRKSALSIMKTEALQWYRDIMTSAKTRIFNISPRIAGRVVQMEAHRDIYTHRFREIAKPFVEAISKLDDKAKLEIKKALLDYWALASEQGENIEQYKQEEVAKLKELLNKYWISDKATNDMFAMLAELWQRYKDAWLKINLSDIYFPRTVTDYEWLQNYIAEQTWIPQENKATLLSRIEKITRDTKLTDEEKEQKIRYWMTTDYHEPWKKSKNAKERKMWLLSEWWEWVYQFYWDPIEALDNYIVTMEDAIQKQLFLWWLQEDAWLKDENVSLEEIIEWLVDEWKISNEDLEELKKSVSAILNKKPTPKIVKTAKSIVHIGLLANFISAVTQFDDLWIVILRDKSWLKNIVKAIFWKAWIKYTDLWLENSYEIFKDQMNITNWFFAKSFFNAIDRLGKTSFINTAWESLKTQAKNTKSRKILIKRLTDMYWAETANHIMEKIDNNDYMTDWQIDIDILTDLLYLLSDTQPLYTSDMPTAYLNSGWVRICYSLQSFTIKRINMLIQWTKQVYNNNWWWAAAAVKAWTWLMYTTTFLAIRWAMIWDAQDFLKWDKDETTLYKLITEWIDAALDQLWKDAKGSWLKMWNLSDYDKKIYKRQWAWWWLMSKFEPPIIWMWADLLEAITEHNKDEITDLAKYWPTMWKLLYYWFWDELSDPEFELDLWDDFELDLWDFELDLDEDFELNI